MTANKDVAPFVTRFPRPLHARLGAAARRVGRPMGQLVIEAVRGYLDELERRLNGQAE